MSRYRADLLSCHATASDESIWRILCGIAWPTLDTDVTVLRADSAVITAVPMLDGDLMPVRGGSPQFGRRRAT
jgi:hypothetical protein